MVWKLERNWSSSAPGGRATWPSKGLLRPPGLLGDAHSPFSLWAEPECGVLSVCECLWVFESVCECGVVSVFECGVALDLCLRQSDKSNLKFWQKTYRIYGKTGSTFIKPPFFSCSGLTNKNKNVFLLIGRGLNLVSAHPPSLPVYHFFVSIA